MGRAVTVRAAGVALLLYALAIASLYRLGWGGNVTDPGNVLAIFVWAIGYSVIWPALAGVGLLLDRPWGLALAAIWAVPMSFCYPMYVYGMVGSGWLSGPELRGELVRLGLGVPASILTWVVLVLSRTPARGTPSAPSPLEQAFPADSAKVGSERSDGAERRR